MEKEFRLSYNNSLLKILVFIIGILWLSSCEDEYYYDDEEPEWLGSSIYDYLNDNGNYTNFVKLIEDAGYKTVLEGTGSKTVFVANDTAFERFFSNNDWGVTTYDELSLSQKKNLLKFSMINNPFLIETLANYYDGSGLITGTALRRNTSTSVIDDIPWEQGSELPEKSWWDRFRSSGLYMVKDETNWPIVHFLESSLDNANISNTDFELITGVERSTNDAHIFDIKVIKRDITCKNGYIHILEDVLVPRVNMAEYLNQNSNTQIFSGLLERFCAPYYNEEVTVNYNNRNKANPIDSIFEKIYFSEYEGKMEYPNGKNINEDLLLPFNPGMNEYVTDGSSLQADMAAILVPTDDAMNEYFNSGSGTILKDKYGTWDKVEDKIAVLLVKRHLRESFLESVPARFTLMTDSENSDIPATKSDIVNTYVGLNGVIYETSKVYPPSDYISVYGPVLFSDKTRVFNWVIVQNEFRLYLNSLVSTYSLFAPTDEFFKDYIDPVAYAKDIKAAMKYWYNDKTNSVVATVYSYDANTGAIGDSINYFANESFIANRLLDLLDAHIVIGDVESGDEYYFTKNGNGLKIEGAGTGLTVQGGFDIEQGTTINVVSGSAYSQENGNTYFIDKPIQTPLRSVYKILSETTEFSDFYTLIDGFSGTDNQIFVKESNFYGLDYNIEFFNTFNYTVYVPTNEAIKQAITDGVIHDWTYIDAIADETEKQAEIDKLERFVRYHFQDNSVFIGGEPVDVLYQTATIKENDSTSYFNTYKNKYYRLGIVSTSSSIDLTTETGGTASVITSNGLYNIMARDYIFSDNPQAYEEADETGEGLKFVTSSITTSSTAVIHQIDKVLNFE